MKLFTLNRFGVVNLNHSSSNQCKEEGWLNYRYQIRITCKNKLDERDFIIDHVVIHETVLDVFSKAGSCERLCLDVESAVLKKLKKHGVEVKKIYVMIQPVILQGSTENHAFMELESNYR